MLKNINNILTILLTTVLFLSVINGNCQVGSRSAGMGNTSVAMTDFWGVMNNQAGIAKFDKPMVGAYYKNSFMLTQLSTKCIAVIFPTKFGVLAASYNHFGYSLYNEQKVGITYARSFGQYFRVGIQLDYLNTILGNNYGNTSNFTFEIGVQSDVNKKVTIGVWVFNPLSVKLADYDNEKIPTIIRFGLLWHISDALITSIETEKNTIIDPIVFRGGLEYNIKQKYFFRTGFTTNKEIFSFGVGIFVKEITFDISAIMHETLGFSPQVAIIFKF